MYCTLIHRHTQSIKWKYCWKLKANVIEYPATDVIAFIQTRKGKTKCVSKKQEKKM